MVEAGTRGINLSLETASPRLQKLLKKNLDLDKFKQVMDYIAGQHPDVILEMASMHGFPGETEEEALMTLDFIKRIKWLHFPYIHILKIFPNTEMETFALEQGISKEDIMKSKDRAFHELPETLPFPKSFTRKYQADFLNNYFLDKERLMQVLPYQMQVLDETALVQKYNAYLPTEIKNLDDIITFAQLKDIRVPESFAGENESRVTIFDQSPVLRKIGPAAKRILFLDLSQHFSSHRMLYRVVEQPLGLIALLTYLKERFGDKIDGRIYKAGNDFDNYQELKALVEAYKPDLLTFFQEFFHQTVSLLRQWGVEVPIITGGPYASSDYDTILKDTNVDLAVLGEGEYTCAELVEQMLKNDFQLPGHDVLNKIGGIAFRQPLPRTTPGINRQVILLDHLKDTLMQESPENSRPAVSENNLAYVMFTSGSTGRPKGVMVEHRQVNNCISWMQDKFDLGPGDVIVNRTNLTFDPSVWEIFWPLYIGAGVKVLDTHQRKDVEFLLRLMSEEPSLTMMYCPSTLVNIMTYLLNARAVKSRLTLPWLIIGAEPISMEVVKNFYRYYDGKIVNTYGPTECVINNTYYDLSQDDERSIVPIGKPVANNKIYILDRNLQPVPLMIHGEICIAGASVARGYINNRQKTGEYFIQNPFGNGKLYKTGDIGRWHEDGNIEIMGRVDEQVKIRGYRIEPREIEHALLSHESIDNCLVLARNTKEPQEKTRECKKCGIWSNYPGISINNEGICGICEKLEQYEQLIDQYFLTLDDLEEKIKAKNKNKKGKYDCILVYACERVATYALYKLVEMGLDVLTVTYDSGHYDRESLERITSITKKIGVDHIFLRHPRSDDILKESLRAADTMCKGCIHTSTAMAGDYAYRHGIKFVIGETLSRGQIVENKLYKFITMGVDSVKELEREIEKLQAHTPIIDKRIFDIINIDVVSNGSIYHQVDFIDFYRYCDVTNEEMIKYLDSKDPYWKSLDRASTYSTDCKICQVGNFNHLKEKGYHYTGSAKSWDRRLGLTTLKDLKEDLNIHLTESQHVEFLEKLGYQEKSSIEAHREYLCAYFVSDRDLDIPQLREYLIARLPGYMIPAYFIRLQQMPLTPNGKIDRRELPMPDGFRPQQGETYIAPKTDMEKIVAEIWKEVLKVDMPGAADNFFDIGGNSLDIIMVSSKLKENLDLEIPVVTLFSYPTIEGLARHLTEKKTGEPLPGKNINNSGKRPGSVRERKSRLRQSLEKRKH
jgi:amino acid adenylation domain-containing protein